MQHTTSQAVVDKSRTSALGLILILPVLGILGCSPAASPDVDYHRGHNALSLGRYDWARTYFSADLEGNPQRRESLRSLGICWVSGFQGSLTKGIRAFEQYLALYPEDTEIQLRLARSWLQLNQHTKAEQLLEKMPASVEVQILLARSSLNSSPEHALERIQEALTAKPDNFEAHHVAAQIQARLHDQDAALDHARAAAKINPLRTEPYYLIAQILRPTDGQAADNALATYDLIHQLPGPGSPRAPAVELAVLQTLQTQLDISNPAFQIRLARLLLQNGKVSDARPLIEQILAVPDQDPAALLTLAQAAHSQGKTAIANDLYEHILNRSPDHQAALSSQARLKVDTLAFEASQQLLDRGLSLYPHYAPLHFTSGLLALAQGKDSQATSYLQTAVHLAPWLARYRLTLTDLLLTSGKREAASKLLAQAPAPDPAIDSFRKKRAL